MERLEILEFGLHFVIGLVGAAAIFAIFFHLSDEESTSAPFGLVFVGIACGVLAVYFSPWATPVVLALYAGMSLLEHQQDKRAANAVESEGTSDE